MKRYAIRFLDDRCIGCHLCELACSSVRLGLFNPRQALLHITHDYLEQSPRVEARLCDGCGFCLEACPTGAISRCNGYLTLDKNTCTSCMECVQVCPNDVVSVWKNFPVICNMCGGSPQCVSWCPREALKEEKEE